jgi:FMN-binding domain protein
MTMKKLQQILMLALCLLVLMVAAVQRDGKVWGKDFKDLFNDKPKTAKIETLRTLEDGTIVVNTTDLGNKVVGYAGTVPLEIYINNGKITQVKPLKNTETPDFFQQAASLLSSWNGKTVDEALKMRVDAVSGATYSSKAIIKNLHLGLAYYDKKAAKEEQVTLQSLDFKVYMGLAVVLLAAILPLFFKNKYYRLAQMLLNVLVLGFGCGTFLSWSLFINYLSSGIYFWASLIPIVMLVTAFIYPLFGKKNYYCNHVCPCGSLQDLLSKTKVKKWRLSPLTIKVLRTFRSLLFLGLLVVTLSGIYLEWIDYEVFSAFLFTSASYIVLALGIVVVVLSLFIPRPYCRFVCPTGCLLRMAEGRK